MLFSDGYVAGRTLFAAGQQGLGSGGKVTGTDITHQTMNAIAAVKKVIVSVTVYFTDPNDVSEMNAVHKAFTPDPKPARVAVQVAGLIGSAKIEIAPALKEPRPGWEDGSYKKRGLLLQPPRCSMNLPSSRFSGLLLRGFHGGLFARGLILITHYKPLT